MNVEIIPAINAETFEEVERRVRQVEPYVRWVHLDVADGTFTLNTLWHNAAELFVLKTNVLIEVHLMVENPEKVVDAWIGSGAKRIIVHMETIKDFTYLKRRCDEAKVLLMLAVAPETSWTTLVPFLKENVVSFQVLAVHPGLPGQKFIDGSPPDTNYAESSYDKIRHLREYCAFCDLEVDGGVKPGIAKKCREAGANLFAAATSIFSYSNAEEAIKNLQNDVA
ncbi:MAG: hypothetical protein HY471_03120 [Candidatus Sungbacteria bacterium]|nr:hypothetical protein [Candidatus Sungbacteria bacterium]